MKRSNSPWSFINPSRIRAGMLTATMATSIMMVFTAFIPPAPAATGEPPALPQPAPSDTKQLDCVRHGREAMATKDFAGAVRLLLDCVKQDPNSVPAHYWLGMAYFLNRDKEKSTEHFKEAVRLDPTSPHGVAMLGRLYSLDETKLSLAEELLKRVAGITPLDVEGARADLARVYAQKGELDKALQLLVPLLDGQFRFALYHTEVGKILQAMGHTDDARKHFERALLIAPDMEPAKAALERMKAVPEPQSRDKGKTDGRK
ncbi:MAG: tetratricopeptide repeat protein [Pseudomonadota bacterium]